MSVNIHAGRTVPVAQTQFARKDQKSFCSWLSNFHSPDVFYWDVRGLKLDFTMRSQSCFSVMVCFPNAHGGFAMNAVSKASSGKDVAWQSSNRNVTLEVFIRSFATASMPGTMSAAVTLSAIVTSACV